MGRSAVPRLFKPSVPAWGTTGHGLSYVCPAWGTTGHGWPSLCPVPHP